MNCRHISPAPTTATPHAEFARFHRGYEYHTADLLGAHRQKDGHVFRVWAPNAAQAFVVGDFCGWETGIAMRRVSSGGVWQGECREASDGALYKFRLIDADGRVTYLADPCAALTETPAGDASRIGASQHRWRDASWLDFRARAYSDGTSGNAPFIVYTLDPLHWLRRDGQAITFEMLAAELAPYVKQMGYTHVRLIPPDEPTLRPQAAQAALGVPIPRMDMGGPDAFCAFVDTMHEAGIGVIVETDLSVADAIRSPEQQSLALSYALGWVERYHADALCVHPPAHSPAAQHLEEQLKKALLALHSDVPLLTSDETDLPVALSPPCAPHALLDRAWRTLCRRAPCTDAGEELDASRDLATLHHLCLKHALPLGQVTHLAAQEDAPQLVTLTGHVKRSQAPIFHAVFNFSSDAHHTDVPSDGRWARVLLLDATGAVPDTAPCTPADRIAVPACSMQLFILRDG